MKDARSKAKITSTATTTNTTEAFKEGTTMKNSLSKFVEAIKNGLINESDIEKLIKSKEQPNDCVQQPANQQEEHWTKAYSVQNVKIIVKMAKDGATIPDVCERFGISRPTVRRYLDRRYTATNRKGLADKYWELLLENTRNAKQQNDPQTDEIYDMEDTGEIEIAETIADVTAETADSEEIIVTDNTNEVQPEKPMYVIDSQMVQRKEGRQHLLMVVAKLKAMNVPFEIHSRERMETLEYTATWPEAKDCARMVLDTLPVAETERYLNGYAKTCGAKVIACTERTRTECARMGVEAILYQDFLTEVEDYTEMSLIEARMYDLPCWLNKNRRIICDFLEVRNAIAGWYGVPTETLQVSICNEAGKQRESKTGKTCLKLNDKITFEATFDGRTIKGLLEVVAETEKANVVQRLYTNQPVSCVSKATKTA